MNIGGDALLRIEDGKVLGLLGGVDVHGFELRRGKYNEVKVGMVPPVQLMEHFEFLLAEFVVR